MKVRFQADADLNEEIIDGLIRRELNLDFKKASEANLRELPDEAVLALAAQDNRVLVSHDRRTMPRQFGRFLLNNDSPGSF